MQALSAQLQVYTSQITQHVTQTLRAAQDAIFTSATNASHAFSFGAPDQLPHGWTSLSASSAYSRSNGFGWTSNVSYIHNGNSSTYPTPLSSPLSKYVWGGLEDAILRVDGLNPGSNVSVTAVVGLWDKNMKVAVTGVRDVFGVNAGRPGARIRSGIFEQRAMRYQVGHTGTLQLRFTGQAIGPQLSIDNSALATEGAFYTSQGWILNALLIHPAEVELTANAEHSFLEHESFVHSSVQHWAYIGPFNDTNATGLVRSVSSAEGDYDLSHSHALKNGTAGQWRVWQGVGPVPVATLIGDDGQGSAAMLQTAVHCPQKTSVSLAGSTSGTGVFYLDSLGIVFVDEVYAGLFDQEGRVQVQLQSGWNNIQVKTLSHFTPRAGWEISLNLFGAVGGSCKVDPCGSQVEMVHERSCCGS